MKPQSHDSLLASQMLMIALVMFSFSLFNSTVPVEAKNTGNNPPKIEDFAAAITKNGGAELRGIYVPEVFALPVHQQPEGKPRFVSTDRLSVTEFNLAARAGNIGLLAHNYLAGKLFFLIETGNRITLIYGDGRMESFIVDRILQYEILPRGTFRDISSGQILNTGELFEVTYGGMYHLTLQTCIDSGGNQEWGRLFILATPEAQPIRLELRPDEKVEEDVQSAPAGMGWPLAPQVPSSTSNERIPIKSRR